MRMSVFVFFATMHFTSVGFPTLSGFVVFTFDPYLSNLGMKK